VIRAVAAGDLAAVLVVPGWLGSPELRRPVMRRVMYGAAGRVPVHVRWAWLREDEDGNTETAFWVWPCTAEHPPGLQCQDGRVFYGIARAGRREPQQPGEQGKMASWLT
jgi:hypothetical protein